jgi:eukaryotic-like serine/threonine-protein kinase
MVRPGDRIAQRYEVLEPLASGGMGAVWRARHVELDVDVALKVISAEATSPGLLKRFKREAQAAARLRSPNIVRVLDYGDHQGQPYLTMELLTGEDLAARLARQGKLEPEACLDILDGVANAVDLAHRAGIVHRDLKPANLFLERVGERDVVKVLDFGVAKDLHRKTEPAATTNTGAVGSPAYMSPEQVWGENVGPAADIWTLGVVAFELLTGVSPFADETLAKMFERIIRAPLPKPSDFDSALPTSLAVFFERAFARTPSERFASACELVEALRSALGGHSPEKAPTVSRLSTTQTRAPGPGRPARRWPYAASALLLLACVAWLSVPRSPRAPTTGAAPASHSVPRRSEVGAAPTAAPRVVPSPAPSVSPSTATAPSVAASRSPAPSKRPRVPPRAPASAHHDPQFGIPLPP